MQIKLHLFRNYMANLKKKQEEIIEYNNLYFYKRIMLKLIAINWGG